MKEIVYNKLVRDKIPEIIEADGKTCKIEILSDAKYLEMIDAKLDEELAEYHKIDLNLPWETLTRNEASRQVDKIISTYGRIPRD